MRKQLAELHVELAENLRRLELGDRKKGNSFCAYNCKGWSFAYYTFSFFCTFYQQKYGANRMLPPALRHGAETPLPKKWRITFTKKHTQSSRPVFFAQEWVTAHSTAVKKKCHSGTQRVSEWLESIHFCLNYPSCKATSLKLFFCC